MQSKKENPLKKKKERKLADMNTNQGKKTDFFRIRNHFTVQAEAFQKGHGTQG